MVLVDSDGIPRVPPYSGALSRQLSISYTGLLPSTVYLSKLFYYTSSYAFLRVLQPQYACTLVWALSLSLAATQEIDVSFFSSGYLDVSVPRVPFHTLWIGVWMTGVLPAGFPHSDISGSLDMCSSPKLFAAYHVFHRLLVPRHPPCALLRLTLLPVIYSVSDRRLLRFHACVC